MHHNAPNRRMKCWDREAGSLDKIHPSKKHVQKSFIMGCTHTDQIFLTRLKLNITMSSGSETLRVQSKNSRDFYKCDYITA